jgi:hypothetical protein
MASVERAERPDEIHRTASKRFIGGNKGTWKRSWRRYRRLDPIGVASRLEPWSQGAAYRRLG